MFGFNSILKNIKFTLSRLAWPNPHCLARLGCTKTLEKDNLEDNEGAITDCGDTETEQWNVLEMMWECGGGVSEPELSHEVCLSVSEEWYMIPDWLHSTQSGFTLGDLVLGGIFTYLVFLHLSLALTALLHKLMKSLYRISAFEQTCKLN